MNRYWDIVSSIKIDKCSIASIEMLAVLLYNHEGFIRKIEDVANR